MRRFEDKVVLVTGAASGIGKATAARLCSEGAQVLCADRDIEGARQVAAAIGAAAEPYEVDVADPAACVGAVEATVSRWGRIDALANIAGIGGFGHAAEIDDAAWRRMIDVNLTGVFQMTRAALRHLEAVRGNIVNIASAAGLVGTPYASAYSAAKSGVVGLTRSIAVEYALRGVRVNAVCPGAVDTPLIAGGFGAITNVEPRLFERLTPLLGAMARPEDIAAAVAFLASGDAAFVTGAILAVDGGQTAA